MSSPRSPRSWAITRADGREPLPTIALRADAGRTAGLGHLRRVDALAVRLSDWARCVLLLDAEPRAAVATPWRRVDPDVEATLAAARVLGAAALVVDSYTLTVSRAAALTAGVRSLVVLEDEGRPVDADVIVSPGLAEGLEEKGRRLAGPRHALLAAEFEAPPARRWPPTPGRALIALGSATPAALIGPLTAAVRRGLPTCPLDLVVGPAGDSRDAIARAVCDVPDVTLHAAPPHLRPLMLAADLAVSAGGVTLLELAACATPTVAVAVAANQQPAIRCLSASAAVVSAGNASVPTTPGTVARMVGSLGPDAARRRALGEAARELVDGRGARRVSDVLRARLAPATAGAGRC
jgi:spore coat polysaccharide biosynthesis predicted glycosyltransferase SpsG